MKPLATIPLKRKTSPEASESDDDSHRNVHRNAVMTDLGRNINDIFDKIGFGWFQIRLLILVGISFSCDAMEINLIVFLQGCVTDEWGLSSSTESILTSAVFAGEIFGMLIFGPFADTYGRRASILLGWILIIIFGFLSCICPSIDYLVATRMLVGVGIGASQTIAYDLFIETVPTDYRNVTGYVSLFGILGGEYVVLMGYLLLSIDGWRWFAFSCTVPIFLLAIFGYFYLPESCRWLVIQGRNEEAEIILYQAAELNNKQYSKIILSPIEKEEVSFILLFERPFIYRNMILWSAWILSYFSYYCILLIFLDFYSDGQCSFEFGYLALAVGIPILGIIVAIQVMNKFGRINSEISYYVLGSVFILLYGLIVTYGNSPATAVSCLLMANVFSFSAISVLWVHTVELFTTELRGTGHASCSIMGRIGAFCAVFWVNDYCSKSGNALSGCVFYTLAALMTALLVSFLPETAGLKLDDMAIIATPTGEEEFLLDELLPKKKTSILGNIKKNDALKTSR